MRTDKFYVDKTHLKHNGLQKKAVNIDLGKFFHFPFQTSKIISF